MLTCSSSLGKNEKNENFDYFLSIIVIISNSATFRFMENFDKIQI